MAQAKTLTAELIMLKTKTNQLDRIRNLNLVANDLADISIVSQMSALEVLSLSVNSISTLKDVSTCYSLKELYLRRNCVGTLDEVEHLVPLTNLKTIWLAENPISTIAGYRQHVIRRLPQLEKLDNIEITAEEREGAQNSSGDDTAQNSQIEQQRFQQNEMNSFAAAAKNRLADKASPQPPQHAQVTEMRVNPNSTNPFFQNKARPATDNNPKSRIGFGSNNEIRRSPDRSENEESNNNEERKNGHGQQFSAQPALVKQNTRQAHARRNIHDKPDQYDLGNNYIRKGTGLARTPTRKDEFKSQSNSPNELTEPRIDVQRAAFMEPSPVPQPIDTDDPSPIQWPSHQENANRQSPIGNQINSNEAAMQRPDSRHSAAAAQQQQVQMQGKQSSPTIMVPRHIRSPPRTSPLQQQRAGTSAIASQQNQGAGGIPQIAMPPNLNDPHQLQQLLQLNQLLLQQQSQMGQISSPGFSGLVQQQNQQMAAAQQQHEQQQQAAAKKAAAQLQQQQTPVGQKKRAQGGGVGMAAGANANEHPYRRDENILCAILALLKELDKNGLEFVIKDCNKRISKMDNNF